MAKFPLKLGGTAFTKGVLGKWGSEIKAGNIMAIGAAIIAGVALYNMFAPKGFPRITAPTGMQWTLP